MSKAVFFDLDNTFLDRHGRIAAGTAEAVRALRANGHYAFVNSGRARGHIRNPEVYEVGFDGMVSGCGTMVEIAGYGSLGSAHGTDPSGTDASENVRTVITPVLREKDIVTEYRMPKELALKAVALSRLFGFRPMLEGREYVYFDGADFDEDSYGRRTRAEVGEYVRPISGNEGGWDICKFACDMRGGDTEGGLRALAEDFEIFVIKEGAVCELVPKGYSKAKGMLLAAEVLGVAASDTVAFGDGKNDTEMLRTAGTGVAMGNAVPEAAAAADYVTGDIGEGGLAAALENLGLI